MFLTGISHPLPPHQYPGSSPGHAAEVRASDIRPGKKRHRAANFRIRAVKRLIMRQETAQCTICHILRGRPLCHHTQFALLRKLPRRGSAPGKEQILILIARAKKARKSGSGNQPASRVPAPSNKGAQTPLGFCGKLYPKNRSSATNLLFFLPRAIGARGLRRPLYRPTRRRVHIWRQSGLAPRTSD